MLELILLGAAGGHIAGNIICYGICKELYSKKCLDPFEKLPLSGLKKLAYYIDCWGTEIAKYQAKRKIISQPI